MTPSLRRTFAVALATSDVPFRSILVLFHERSLEPHMDQVQYCTITNALRHYGHEIGVGNGRDGP